MEQLGQYKILHKLGAGAMGEVYLAEHQLLKAKRALKVLPGELSASQSFRERFMAEGQVLARLHHPHIVQVHDMGTEGNTYYIAMDFVSPDGKHAWPLDKLLARTGGRMQPGAAARVLLQVCEAIAYAHEQGVVHCDIKPSNILVVRNNEVCVSDFGLSKVLGQSYLNTSIQASLSGSVGMDQTQVINAPHAGTDDSFGAETTLNGQRSSRAKSLVGTFHYMPPEVQKGQEWTEQGDIYSIGVLTYLLLTGDLPIGRWKLPSEIIPHLEFFWDRLLEQTLQTDPARRFPSTNAILEFIRKQGHTATVTPRSFGQCDDVPLLVRQQVRNFVETHQGRWTETQFLEFQVQLYQNPDHAGVPRNAILEAVDIERNQWLEKNAREKEEEARLAEEHRKAAEEAEHRFLEARDARKRIESAMYPAYGQRPGQVQAFAGIDFCWIPPGNFMMGYSDSPDSHQVTLTRGFWLGKYPVTQAQWEVVMGNNPSCFQKPAGFLWLERTTIPELPVEQISWNDCKAFCGKLSRRGEGTFRLPTEAEWEYACRAGSTTEYYFGDDEHHLDEYAWYRDNSGGKTVPVGTLLPNAWGLHDMHGNVFEWCEDDWHDCLIAAWHVPYVPKPTDGSAWVDSPRGKARVYRGGSWGGYATDCRSANRRGVTPEHWYNFLGFRLALSPVQ